MILPAALLGSMRDGTGTVVRTCVRVLLFEKAQRSNLKLHSKLSGVE
jgi:hypothetical protein